MPSRKAKIYNDSLWWYKHVIVACKRVRQENHKE